MNGISFDDIGLPKGELQQRLIDALCEQMLGAEIPDEFGNLYLSDSEFHGKLSNAIKLCIDASVDTIASTHVLPNVQQYIENVTLTKTNKWGEAQGKTFTFTEYLVERAEQYLIEPVDNSGKAKGESTYTWHKNTTRIAFMVDKHLHHAISTAMEEALKDANNQIVVGIEEAVKIQLDQVRNKLKVKVTT